MLYLCSVLPALSVRGWRPSVLNNAVNLSSFSPSGQLGSDYCRDRMLELSVSGPDTDISPVCALCAASYTLITSDKTETPAAVCMQHTVLVSLPPTYTSLSLSSTSLESSDDITSQDQFPTVDTQT